jgi:predicted short-subunit dehydrogenase-like oxidoreductase (DUF2520 family)
MIKVVILGGGNLAFHLTNALLKSKNIEIIQLFNRSIEKIKPFEIFIPITNKLKDLKIADIYIIAISDNYISEFSSLLNFEDKLVVHTSGAISLEDLKSNSRKGVFYPLQTFSKNAILNFAETPICIEASIKKDEILLKKLAKSISKNTYVFNSTQRKSLHVAAVFVNNFVNHLYYLGNKICDEHKIPFEILFPLIKETATKIETLSPFDAQTGPAKRNDTKTIKDHLAILSANNEEIYTLLTNSIKHTYGKKL